ncbi:Dihydrofolate synthase (EC @ Folylpolyglutamate synthase (EC [Olavius algarvensis associated proteobacterium Delta 3]|nr:Dihydrofolate synthase (EC @ Folylpolyglutamate synthase (EC [Olavius algarvensis associated proteobacterium Delta 3]CAB5138788.1 Dihydrofolate synthase (EC @ Folylpolyglutamate synthase (EC [Olavius algarvensis associated proteobacterium Delta 3]
MTPDFTYEQRLDRMYGLRRFGIKLGLDTIERILEGLGSPQKKFRCIHVAGTNGKGSIASALSTILAQAGYRTGLFTSPHLVRFNERICVDNHQISDEEMVNAYEAINSVDSGDREPTFFEFSTAMALYEFGRRNVDWAVVETGMGGRLDATNIIRPSVCIITNISLEHKDYLGSTIAAIAGEKAGIIKPGIPLVTGVRQKTALSVIETCAGEKEAAVSLLGRDFRVRRNRREKTFNYYGMDGVWSGMQTGLSGAFQVENAAMVLATCELLNRQGAALQQEAVGSGLKENRWPGRLEQISDRPLIILDGAHNLMAARHLRKYLAEELANRHITLVVGILDDKPYKMILKDLAAHADRIIVTRPRIDRALPPETLYPEAGRLATDIEMMPDVASAVQRAVETTDPQNVVVIAGSLYVVGEAKEFFESPEGRRWVK